MRAEKTLTAIINPRNKPMYLGVSTETPHEGKVFIFDKIKSTDDPYYRWGWETTKINRVNKVEVVFENIYKVSSKEAIYIITIIS
jgi:hypothetical protein